MALLSALAVNKTLTLAELRGTGLGGVPAAEALAASLRTNRTLRTLDLSFGMEALGGPEGVRLVLGALGCGSGCSSASGCCGLTTLCLSDTPLELAACAALGRSLSSGATLEELDVRRCSIQQQAAAAIADGLVAAGAASRLRRLDMGDNQVGHEGAPRHITA